MDLSSYLAKIPPLHATKPNFVATVSAALSPFVAAQSFLQTLPEAFDIDLAVGVQLDIVGLWEGRSRQVKIPLQDVFFSLDDPIRGLDKGIWWNPDVNPGVSLQTLDDEVFRRVLKAVAIANEWDGSIGVAQAALDQFLPPGQGTYTFIQDNAWGLASGTSVSQGISICVSGVIPPVVDLLLLEQNILGLKPGGVAVDYAVTSQDGLPIFGLDVDNDYLAGFDEGAWAVTPDFIAHADSDLLAAA